MSGLFGNAGNTGGMFGQSAGSTQSGSLFGTGTQNQMPQQQQQQQQQQIPDVAFPWWLKELLFIQASYSTSDGAKLFSFVYDKLPLNNQNNNINFTDIGVQRKKAFFELYPWMDERQWNNAQSLIPKSKGDLFVTPIVGVDALKNRVELQATECRSQLDLFSNDNWVKNVAAEVTNFSLEQSLNVCRKEQQELMDRLVRIIGRIEKHIALITHKKISPEEKAFQSNVDQLTKRYSDLTNKLSVLKSKKIIPSSAQTDVITDVEESLSEEFKSEAFSFLEDQHHAIEEMIKVVKKDMKDFQTMQKLVQ